jgi:Ring finger domain
MAPKLLKCLLQVCFDDTPDEPTADHISLPPQQNHIFRLLQHPAEPFHTTTAAATYSLAAVEDPAGDNDAVGGGGNCCETNTRNNQHHNDATAINRMSGIREFWKNVQERLNLAPPVETTPTTTSATESQEEQEYVPILTEASSFDSSQEVPTISTDQIVLPGSQLQMEMAKAMAAQLGANHCDHDECVICMDGFDPSNPRMPTLCGCGENKTYFHLPCLYQWVEQSGRKCPSCRKRLRWEEF